MPEHVYAARNAARAPLGDPERLTDGWEAGLVKRATSLPNWRPAANVNPVRKLATGCLDDGA